MGGATDAWEEQGGSVLPLGDDWHTVGQQLGSSDRDILPRELSFAPSVERGAEMTGR